MAKFKKRKAHFDIGGPERKIRKEEDSGSSDTSENRDEFEEESSHSSYSDNLNTSGIDPETLELWRERIKEEYTKIFYIHQDRLIEKGPKFFVENRAKSISSKRRFKLPKKAVKFSVAAAIKPLKGAKNACLLTSSGRRIEDQRLQLRPLPDVKSIPVMYAWAPTQTNIHIEDEKSLSHVPFIEDIGDEDSFVGDLKQHYTEGIHGDGQKTDFINDRMLYDLIKILMDKYLDLSDMEAPQIEILEGIAAEFPNKGSRKKLEHKWSDLVLRYGSDEAQRSRTSSVLPNVDGNDAIVASAERTMDSYMGLLCLRCYKYDCFLHGQVEEQALGVIHKKVKKMDFTCREPCSDDCYLHDLQFHKSPSSPEILYVEIGPDLPSSSQRINKIKQPKLMATTEGWTAADKSMFHVLRGVYGDDYCGIADSMIKNPKTCKEIRIFAHNEGLFSPKNEAPISPKIPAKKNLSYKDKVRRYRAAKWVKGNGIVANDKHYVPCNHPGQDCNTENCSCEKCLKYCACSETCTNRFPGCRCAAGCKTDQCECFKALTECDPDICACCGAAGESSGCRNVTIQRGYKQHLLLAPSDVSGWGIFLKNAVTKNDFIAEYCGERISQEEGERRGKIYDKKKCSYLFTLNDKYVIDATWKGNKIRFANHSVNPNCHARIMMVNGDQRIGIYAKRDIEAGEELFFDYSYDKQQRIKFVSVERSKRSTVT